MIKTTLGAIVAATQAVGKLNSEPLQVSTAFKVAKLTKAIAEEYKLYDEQRIKLLERHGTISEDGGHYDIPADKQDAFAAAMAELQAQETELNCEKINLAGEDIKITANDIIALAEFIEEV
ncbi:MAG: hypothetical protein QM689_04355 [Oscillospiraceae bacterium]